MSRFIVPMLSALMLTSPIAAQAIPTPPPGVLVDIGGWRLHLNCQGAGSPTVVFESGAGDPGIVWGLVQPPVAQFTRACSYDRAGLAWSDPGPMPRTMRQVAYELRLLLTRAGEKPPYVLVSHSLGGFFARVFNRDHGADVVGFVFADVVMENNILGAPEQLRSIRDRATGRPVPAVVTKMAPSVSPDPFIVADTVRLPSDRNPMSRLTPAEQRAYITALRSPISRTTNRSEQDLWAEEAQELFVARTANPRELGDKPTIVLTRDVAGFKGGDSVSMAVKGREHQWLSQASTRGALRILPDLGHEIHLKQPDAVVDAIRDVLAQLRARSP